MLIIAVVFFLIAGSSAQVFKGPCPKITGVPMDLYKLHGTWYQYAVSMNRFIPGQKCQTQFYQSPECGVLSSFFSSYSEKTKQPLTTMARIYVRDNTSLLIDVDTPNKKSKPYEKIILAIDYDKFGITWSCKPRKHGHEQELAIFTHEKIPTIDPLEMTRKIYASYGMQMPNLALIDHNNCP